jgi:hypothetical protein
MSPHAGRIAARAPGSQAELIQDFQEQQRRWHYRVHRGRVWFDREVARAHRRLRQGIPAFIGQGSLLSLLTTPVIYSLAFPLLLMDLWITLYQLTCFPVYGIPRVRRREYFVVDRHKLGYLNAIEKAHCVYCSYATGVIGYAREVAARTEQYWCPIKHARRFPQPHPRYQRYVDYGDAAGYRHGLREIREDLRSARRPAASPRGTGR